jgi:Xaa-Pro aminopeptidase
MSFSPGERESRHKAFRKILETEGLQALLLIGNTSAGPGFNGDLRYYTDNRIIFYRQVVLIFLKSEPVLFAGTEIQRQAALRRSTVKDCRLIGDDFIADVAGVLREHGVSKGRVGVNLEMLPTAWYLYLKKEFPQIEWVETHGRIMQLRSRPSKEEMEVFRKGAKLGDRGFDAALKTIRPGVDEFEIAAEIERAARAGGGEDHFTLIGSGKFSFGDDNTLPLPYSPSPRRIESGDSVVMEITPRYEGYWTQLVRTVNVGRSNKDLEKIHHVCLGAIKKSLGQVKPGKKVKDVVLAMEESVKADGFLLKPPIGHMCGVDLMEARVSQQNEMVLESAMAIIIHPTVFTPDGKSSFFWGETYLVTPDGFERLHRSTDELLTL